MAEILVYQSFNSRKGQVGKHSLSVGTDQFTRCLPIKSLKKLPCSEMALDKEITQVNKEY